MMLFMGKTINEWIEISGLLTAEQIKTMNLHEILFISNEIKAENAMPKNCDAKVNHSLIFEKIMAVIANRPPAS